MKEFKTALLVTIAVFAVFFFYTKFAGPIPFFVQSIQTTKTTLFTVSGTGEETGIPNTVSFTIGVTDTASSVTTAQNQINSVINKAIDDLKKVGVEEKDIKTTDYNLSPNYNYSNGNQIPTGYTATQDLQIEVSPIDSASKAIDAAIGDGANLTGGISFIFDDKTQKELENKARIEAVQNAEEKAQSLASASGIKLGKIVDVEETPDDIRPVVPGLNTEMNAALPQTTTNITPGQNTITSTVTISYETY